AIHHRVPDAAVGALEVRSRSCRLVPMRLTPHTPVAPALVQFALRAAESGVPVFAPDEVASFLPQWAEECLEPASGLEYLHRLLRSGHGVAELNVLTHSRGNFFFEEVRDLLAATWRRAGARVYLGDERSRPRGGRCRNVIVRRGGGCVRRQGKP